MGENNIIEARILVRIMSQTDFKALVEEAVRETYSPMAKQCWFKIHKWTMWHPQKDSASSLNWNAQTRRCTRCGWTEYKRIQ